MRRKTPIALAIFMVALITSCTSSGPAQPAKTQLEIRQMQTHVFDVDNFKLVMKAMLNVLQDEGYLVKNVDLRLGFLTATKEVDIEPRGVRFWGGVFGGGDRWVKTGVLDVTANVTEFGSRTKVRVNFQLKKLDNYGAVVEVYQIQDPNFYQTFFSKVSKSIFIQEEKL